MAFAYSSAPSLANNCGRSGEFSEPRLESTSLPICLLSCLNTITIWGFEGKLGEMEAAKYLLKNTEVLKKMTIYTHDRLCKKEEFNKEFSMFEMGSKTCQVEFI
ncbi:hypothetical protein C1H46_028909 [Malus baccata]|uniref:FBD domain-containing protein n=1 Tax=Malus baccata TaxID=106549 RepID=A0A540LGF1_MALBA|nr:hypothetical protein C1H46_028909 [Malus baccata]